MTAWTMQWLIPLSVKTRQSPQPSLTFNNKLPWTRSALSDGLPSKFYIFIGPFNNRSLQWASPMSCDQTIRISRKHTRKIRRLNQNSILCICHSTQRRDVLLPHFHEEMLRSWLSCNRTPGRPALDTAPPPGPVRDCTTFIACLSPFHKNMPVEIFTWLRSLLLFLQQCILWFLRRPLPVQTCSHYWTS